MENQKKSTDDVRDKQSSSYNAALCGVWTEDSQWKQGLKKMGIVKQNHCRYYKSEGKEGHLIIKIWKTITIPVKI